jgi:hypothetical protein
VHSYLEKGRYTLMTRGQYWRIHDGTYVIKMFCSDGATTRSIADNDPGGLLVDPRTGAISGTPQRAGENYTMELQAVDAARQVATVASWHFSVRDRVFYTSDEWSAQRFAYNATRNLVARYHTNELHTILLPSADRSVLFVNPSNEDVDNIVFLLLVNGTLCNEPLSAFVNVITGAGVFTVPCAGNFTATLKARDVAGFEAVVNQWQFQARNPDTTVPEYVPKHPPPPPPSPTHTPSDNSHRLDRAHCSKSDAHVHSMYACVNATHVLINYNDALASVRESR